jgi:hypothetical protein
MQDIAEREHRYLNCPVRSTISAVFACEVPSWEDGVDVVFGEGHVNYRISALKKRVDLDPRVRLMSWVWNSQVESPSSRQPGPNYH